MTRKRIALLFVAAVCMLTGCSGVKKEDGVVYFDALSSTIPKEASALSDSELDLPTADLIDVCLGGSYDTVFNTILFYANVYQLNTKTGETVSNAMEQKVTDDWGRSFFIPKNDFYDAWRDFNGICELETRSDAASCLLAKYQQSELDDYQTKILEVLLSEEIYFNRFTETQRAELYATLETRYGADRSKATDANDQSYRFYPYYPAEVDTAE